MFEQNNGQENTYVVSIHTLFVNLCQFYWQIKSTDTSDHLISVESLKSQSA